tara:strand:- start:618 stop:2216 length:1599 start_codon:yes stop_codon:yes gene_type:complete
MPPTSKQRQIKEIVKCGKDPVYFFNKYAKIQHPTRGLIPFKTFDFQDECATAFNENRFNIILKSRQLGLSTLSAAYAVWLAAFYKDKSILVIATKLAVAMNFIKKVKIVIRNMPKWLLLPEIVENNKQSVLFSNGSQIKAIPTSEDAGRSEALTLLIVDEAAFVRNFDEVYTGLYSTLQTGGRAIILSTPNGVGNMYHKLYVDAEAGLNEYNPIKLPWNVHPDHNDEWFEKESRNMSKAQVAQELMCDFAASGNTFLQSDDIDYLRQYIKSPLERWGPQAGVWLWKYPLSDRKYIISADVSRGDASDFSTFHVIDTVESEVVCEFKGKSPPDEFAVVLAEAGRKYLDALICPENNSYGYALIMKLAELDYPNLYYANDSDRYASYGKTNIAKIGFQTNSKTRAQILSKLEEVIRRKHIKSYSSRLYDELKTFVWKNGKAQAQKGKNDDLVMSLAIGVWLYDTAPVLTQQGQNLMSAMLQAFAVNATDEGKPKNPFVNNAYDYRYDMSNPVAVSEDPMGKPKPDLPDFWWLYK